MPAAAAAALVRRRFLLPATTAVATAAAALLLVGLVLLGCSGAVDTRHLTRRWTSTTIPSTRMHSTYAPSSSSMPPSSSSSSSSSSFVTTLSIPALKQKICQLAALMDRGKLQDPLISDEGLYQEEKQAMLALLEGLIAKGQQDETAMYPALLEGDWELIYSTKQLFRSSPFFQAIERAYDDPSKSELFFKLHELQTCSWGASQIGRVAQTIELGNNTLLSSFDTVLFPITTIPVIGWFKLLPTFGGRVISSADGLKVRSVNEGKALRMEYEVAKTSFQRLKGLGVMPLFGEWFEEKQFPTKAVWQLLPWNWGGDGPRCEVEVTYLDEDFRVVRELGTEGYFVYGRPILL